MLNFLQAQSPLNQHQWEHRVLLFFAPDSNHVSLRKQLDLLTQENEKVTDRDLVFYKIYTGEGAGSDGGSLNKIEINAIRRQFEVPDEQFAVILIGKDGTEKLRRLEVVKSKEIFDLIDSMPMRQAEMRRKNRKN